MGRQVRAGFLGPPRVLSSVVTSEGPFVRPFIQKSGCDCMGTNSLRALTSHPCLWLSRERVSQAPLRKPETQTFYFWVPDLFIHLACTGSPAPGARLFTLATISLSLLCSHRDTHRKQFPR